MFKFSSPWGLPQPRGPASDPATKAGSNPCRSLPWEIRGRNKYAPTVVPAPIDIIEDDIDLDFDFVIDFLKSDEDFEDNDFEDFAEHLDNQWF